jgi:integrative and conjugative element protein (TIGR02256 family)
MQLTVSWASGLEFEIGQSMQRLKISRGVLKHFRTHQQTRPDSLEAGGQLFAKLSLEKVTIERATGPRGSDFRDRALYVPDRAAEQAEIDFWHRNRLHYVGDWHTHPEKKPNPSGYDMGSIRDSFVQSRHNLQGFLLIIVGTAGFPQGLYVSLNNGQDKLVLVPRP